MASGASSWPLLSAAGVPSWLGTQGQPSRASWQSKGAQELPGLAVADEIQTSSCCCPKGLFFLSTNSTVSGDIPWGQTSSQEHSWVSVQSCMPCVGDPLSSAPLHSSHWVLLWTPDVLTSGLPMEQAWAISCPSCMPCVLPPPCSSGDGAGCEIAVQTAFR